MDTLDLPVEMDNPAPKPSSRDDGLVAGLTISRFPTLKANSSGNDTAYFHLVSLQILLSY